MITELSFEELVAREVKKEASDAQIAILSEDYRRWLGELNKLKRDVEIQLAAQRARISGRKTENMPRQEWLQFKAAEEQWKLGALRFMASIEEKMIYVKRLKADANAN